MRLPSEAELSKEQREACNLDTEGINLVIGPPGSGKTVVAIFTKNILENSDEEVTATAWNNVLSVYGGMELTFEKWLGKWWPQLTGQRFPSYKAEGEYRRKQFLVEIMAVPYLPQGRVLIFAIWGKNGTFIIISR